MRKNGSIIGVRNDPKGNITRGVWSLPDAGLGRLNATWPASSFIDYNAGTFSGWTTGSAPSIYNDGPAHGKGSYSFAGGVLTPSGDVILVPHNSANVGIVSGGASVPTSTDTALTGPYLNKL